MEILIIAYEFSPICSAQALRWHYLSAELAGMGHGITVLTSDFRVGRNRAPAPDPRVRVVRSFPGPFVGLANRVEERLARGRESVSHSVVSSDRTGPSLAGGYRFARKVLDQVVFPDVRSEWYPFAALSLRRLSRMGYRPDLVIGSHEPAVDLQLGISARRRFCIPFVADFGDPIETVYSPRWRRRLDRRYERYVLERADGVVFTLESVGDRLEQRHSRRFGRMEVVPQGFDHRRSASSDADVPFCPERLNILFTGTLYESFRNPVEFLDAVARRSDVQLWIAGNLVGEFPVISRSENIRMLGPMAHADTLDAQAGADVLLSIGNRQAEQIPGKIYEYIGSRRPILHVCSTEFDPTSELLRQLRRGWIVQDERKSCRALLDELVERWRAGRLEQGLDLAASHSTTHSWQARAERLIRFANSLQNEKC